MFTALSLCALLVGGALAGPPPFPEKAKTARWLVHNVNAGVLSTTSIHLNGTAFGNPISFADASCPTDSADSSPPAGQLFFYTSSLDTSMQDIVQDDRVSLAMSLQMYADDSKNPGVGDYCTSHSFVAGGDAEDPRCTRLTISGKWRLANDNETAAAKEVMFARHPAMKDWPVGHDFTFNTIDITDIWLIDTFGGATILNAEQYYQVKCLKSDDFLNHLPTLTETDVAAPQQDEVGVPPWPHTEYLHTARWLTHASDYGVLSTTSVRLNGSAFGNMQSFVDGPVDNSTGKLFFYASSMDASMVDLAENPHCSFTLSEEWLHDSGNSTSCTQQDIDAEDPTCTRLVLSGQMSEVKNDTSTYTFAHAALFARHPMMKQWPVDHSWMVMELEIEALWLINYYGGAQNLLPKDYYSYVLPSSN